LGEAAKMAATTGSLTANGYAIIPVKGVSLPLIIQWGTVAATTIATVLNPSNGWGQSQTQFTYPISFTTACFSCTCSLYDGATGSQWVMIAQTTSPTKIGANALFHSIYLPERAPVLKYIAVGI